MLVAGNDRVQAVITQMEEVCQTIEVSVGWEDNGTEWSIVCLENCLSWTSGQTAQKVSGL